MSTSHLPPRLRTAVRLLTADPAASRRNVDRTRLLRALADRERCRRDRPGRADPVRTEPRRD